MCVCHCYSATVSFQEGCLCHDGAQRDLPALLYGLGLLGVGATFPKGLDHTLPLPCSEKNFPLFTVINAYQRVRVGFGRACTKISWAGRELDFLPKVCSTKSICWPHSNFNCIKPRDAFELFFKYMDCL